MPDSSTLIKPLSMAIQMLGLFESSGQHVYGVALPDMQLMSHPDERPHRMLVSVRESFHVRSVSFRWVSSFKT